MTLNTMRKSWGITWRAVGVSPPSCPHLTRRAYAAPLAIKKAGEPLRLTSLYVNDEILIEDGRLLIQIAAGC